MQATKAQWPFMLFRETPAKHGTAQSGNQCQAAAGEHCASPCCNFKFLTNEVECNTAAALQSKAVVCKQLVMPIQAHIASV